MIKLSVPDSKPARPILNNDPCADSFSDAVIRVLRYAWHFATNGAPTDSVFVGCGPRGTAAVHSLIAVTICFFVSSCGQPSSGVVLDATDGKPVTAAVVEVRGAGWGIRDKQLVWDAEKVSRVFTGAGGSFRLDLNGGVSMRVRSLRYPSVDTKVCASSPMIVRIGGPYARLRADRRLVFNLDKTQERPIHADPLRSASEDDLGLSVSSVDMRIFRFTAVAGLRFVDGTGVIPPPPSSPYIRSVDLDLGSRCGWLFVSDGHSPIAVIEVGGFGLEEGRDGITRLVLLHAPLSKR